jgi:hypothetical protein
MRKKDTMNIFLALMITLLLLSPVQAALIVNKVTDEFSIESPYPVDNVKACQCGTRTEIIEIKNLGDFDTLFKVEIFSPIKDFITMSKDTYSLKPGESTKAFVYISAPCEASLNTFYVTKVSTNYGRSKEIYKDFVSQKCQNIKFTSKVMSEKILPGDLVTIKVDVQNVGEFPDTFTLVPDANQEVTSLSESNVTLDPDQHKSIFMYLKFPLSVYGTINQPFRIIATRNNNFVNGFEKFNIEKDYDFSMKTEDLDLNVCEDITTKSVVTFQNLAGTPNNYFLDIKGPSFVNLTQDKLDLNSQESDSIMLAISPKKTDVGTYDVVLRARTEYGNVIKDKGFKLNVNNCFESSATLEGWDKELSDKGCCGEKTYTLNVRNDGLYEETYQVIVDSPGWLSISDENEFLRLRPSQQVNIPVKASLPCTDAKQASFIIVKQLKAPYQTHEIRVDLESLSPNSCYDVELLQDNYQINYETQSIPLLIKNTGLRGGTYSLKLGALDSKFVYLDSEEMNFTAGESKVIHVYPRNFSQYRQGRYLDQLSLQISPTEVKSDITYERQFWVVLKDKSFLAKIVDYLRNFNYSRMGFCGVITLVLGGIILMLAVIIIYMRTKKDFKMKRIKATSMKKIKGLNMAIIALLLITILGIILMGSPDMGKFYEEPSNKTSALFHEWKQNTAYKIDLSKYFTDPDLESLKFTASQPNHIQVKIEGAVAILTPEYNWGGTEYIVFTAKDPRGGSADSDVMTLHVIKRKPVSFMDYWNIYCRHINLGLIAVILLLCLMITDVVEDKGYNYYNPRKNKLK